MMLSLTAEADFGEFRPRLAPRVEALGVEPMELAKKEMERLVARTDWWEDGGRKRVLVAATHATSVNVANKRRIYSQRDQQTARRPSRALRRESRRDDPA